MDITRDPSADLTVQAQGSKPWTQVWSLEPFIRACRVFVENPFHPFAAGHYRFAIFEMIIPRRGFPIAPG